MLKIKFQLNKTAQGNAFIFLFLYVSFLFFFSFSFFGSKEGVEQITHCVSLVEDYEGRSIRRKYLCKELKELSELPCSEIFSMSPFHFFFCAISFLLRVHWNWNLHVSFFGLILVITSTISSNLKFASLNSCQSCDINYYLEVTLFLT